MRQEIIALYDDYTHEHLDRRVFMGRLAALAGGTAAAAALLPLLEASPAQAAIVPADDPRLASERVSYGGDGGPMHGTLVRPAGAAERLPGIVVIHENRGLNPHIEDVARRAALAGFVALAPDFLSPSGGTPADPDTAREMIRALDPGATVAGALGTVAYLKAHPACTGRVGAVGFCWGGWLANQVAVNAPDLEAAVAFYGRQPDAGDVPRIKAALLLHYAGLDQRINAGISAYESALKANGVEHEIRMYEGVNHAFHNDTAAARYDKAAAELAWSRTIEFFRRRLGG